MSDLRNSQAVALMARVATALALATALNAFGQVPRDLLEEALDQPVGALEIRDVPIRDALSQIEQQTGLRFAVAADVLELMPYGERTRVSIEMRGLSVRAALSRVLAGLGLQMVVEDGQVVVVPAPVLERLGRPLTVAEAGTLSRLAGQSWSQLQESAERVALDFRIDPAQQPRERLQAALAQSEGPTALRQLEAACEALRWVWRPEEERVVIEARRDEIRRRLDWPLDLTYQREPLDRVLADLGRRVGVLVKFEPGALQLVQARDRTVDLIQREASVRQVLERICGNTGLRYEIDDEGVRILRPLEASAGPSRENIEQWVRIELEVRPGLKMDIFMRQDQLPPRFREEADRKLREFFGGQ